MNIYRTGLLMLLGLLMAFSSAANADAYDDALRATGEGHLREATTFFKRAGTEAATNPELLRALWGLADVYRQQGKYNAALETLRRVEVLATSEDASAATQLRLGGVYFGLGRYAESDAALSQAKQLEARLRQEAR